MKILIITLGILNLLAACFLIWVTPIVEETVCVDIASQWSKLTAAGVIDNDKLKVFQNQKKEQFNPENVISIGEWLFNGRCYKGLLLNPCCGLLIINGLVLIGIGIRNKKSQQSNSAYRPPAAGSG